ncbi:PAS domain-containing protein, partial [Streptomyces sp. NPDC059717]
MTTISLDAVTLGKQLNASDIFDTAIALLDEQGTVAAWTHTAERLLGHSAGDIVGRSAALVLPSLDEATPTSAFVERCRAENGWPGATAVRRRDGRVLDVNVRITALHGQDGSARWLASVTDAGMPSGDAVDGSVRGPLLARAPIGVGVRDRQLRSIYVNDVAESHDGLSPDRRLGRRFTDVLPGANAETIEAVMRQVLHNGTTKIHEYRTWLPTSQGAEKPFTVSFQCLQGTDGESLGVCVISADVTASWQARERLAVLDRASARLGSTLDVMQAGQELADLAVPLLADYVAVDLEQSISFGEGPPVGISATGSRLPAFRRAGLASIRQG